jgi:methionyl-tRNA formyltransferase
MRILLIGQKAFGAAVYDSILVAGHEVVGVWSPVDYGQRIGLDVTTDALTRVAHSSNVLVPPMDRTPGMVDVLDADLIVAAHAHDYISRGVREAARHGAIGYHPSLLPRHRGRDAIRWTIHMGDPITGGTVYWLDDGVDTGPIAAQDWCWVPPRWRMGDPTDSTDGVKGLWKVLFRMGLELLVGTILDVDRGIIVKDVQSEPNATWEPSWERPPLRGES